MNVLVTGANGQLGCWMRLAVSFSPAAASTSDGNYFSCGCSKNQFPSSSNAPAHAAGKAAAKLAAEPSFNYLFSDISELSAESREMLRKLGGKGVNLSTARLDVTDLAAVREMVRNERVDAIVNCAGFTNVDAAESQPEVAELLNAKAVENLAVAMKEVGGLLVHVSTDYVFGGQPCDRPIPEDFPTAPLGAYARSKLHGEEAILRVGCRHVILRTAWLFSEFGRNFVRTMLRLTAERPQVKVVDDQRGTPTYAADLAGVILAVLSAYAGSAASSTSDASAHAADIAASFDGTLSTDAGSASSFSGLTGESPNIYHFTNEGACTWYAFAREILRQAQDDRRQAQDGGRQVQDGRQQIQDGRVCEILPCRSEEFPSPVRRPAYSVLDKSKIKAALGLEIPEWQDGLRRCLASLL